MIYLKEFETEQQYGAAKDSGLILPSVSLVTESGNVYYNPHIDPYNGHEYVDLGLPSGIKWATMNIGATSVADAGLYFQWGDTQGYTASQVGSGEGQKYFGWEDYKYWTADTGSGSSGRTKYNSTDGKTVLDVSDDAATANWSGGWRMPTEADFTELVDGTTNDWVSDYKGSGMRGRVFRSKSDTSKELFLPFAGYCIKGSLKDFDIYGSYWTSSYTTSGRYFDTSTGYSRTVNKVYIRNCCYGCSVRGVIE